MKGHCMFGNVKFIVHNQQFISDCICETKEEAENIFIRYKILAEQNSVEINYFETTVRIQSGQAQCVEYIKRVINGCYFMPPLEINVFWGKHKENISEKWCIGFNYPDATKVIELLNNTQGRFIYADKHPSNWKGINSESYSIVMLTRVVKKELDEQSKKLLKEDIENCCAAIQNITFRKITVSNFPADILR